MNTQEVYEGSINSHYNVLQVSARYWDHNDTFEQFLGSHALVSCGLSKLLSRICPDCVRLNSRVTEIEKKENLLYVKCYNGDIYTADQVTILIIINFVVVVIIM